MLEPPSNRNAFGDESKIKMQTVAEIGYGHMLCGWNLLYKIPEPFRVVAKTWVSGTGYDFITLVILITFLNSSSIGTVLEII